MRRHHAGARVSGSRGAALLSRSDRRQRRAAPPLPGPGRRDPGVSFVGRLAEYRYYNMDQVVAAALRTAARIADRLAGASPAAGQAAASATSE